MAHWWNMAMNVARMNCCEEIGKVFNDAVHGAISLPAICVSVIDTPQFQRLRFLKQLGVTMFVYPSASHNRFEHCLGVCHLAGQLVRALQARQPDLGITEEDVLCVMLAGLCHDLGHGPFSHMWEEFVKQARPGSCWKHEHASVKMFEHLLHENPHLHDEFKINNLTNKDLSFIKELILGPKNDCEDWPYDGRPKEKAFLYEVVANKRTGIDVDKWDYILRDCQSLGIKVTFDYHRLLKFSRVIDVEGEGTQICIRDKECNNLYDMFHSRRTLHRIAYQHRVVKTLDAMLIDAFLYADQHIHYQGKDGVKLTLANVCDDMIAFTLLTDEVFHRILLTEGNHPDLLKAKRILNDILIRRLYLCVGHTQPSNYKMDSERFLAALEHNIPKGSTLTRDKLGLKAVKLNYGMGDKDPIELVRFYSKNLPNQPKSIRKEEISTMLPQSFQETAFQLLCKSYDEQEFKDAQDTIFGACLELNLEKPSVESWPSLLTPVKGRSHPTTSLPILTPAIKRLTLDSGSPLS